MSAPDPNAAPASDPSMEDILASIRRILADGEEGGAAPESEEAAYAAEPVSQAVSTYHAPVHDDVFVLDRSMLIEEPLPMTPPEPESPGAPVAAAPLAYSPLDAGELPAPPLLAPETEAAAGASLGALARAVSARQVPVYRGGPTLEDMVRDELRPLVKEWLDAHLAPMVERMVRAEIDRVAKAGS